MKKIIRLAGLMFCAIIIAAGALVATEEAAALSTTSSPAPDFNWYNADRYNKNGPGKGTNKYLKECVPGVNAIGEVFVHGGNARVDRTALGIGQPVTVKCYVDNYGDRDNVTIQGKKINKGWIVCENMQHLWNLAHDPRTGIKSHATHDAKVGWTSVDADAQEFFASEGEKFQVVEYDDNWVYFWSTGTRAYTSNALDDCSGWLLMNTHPAGFYKIARSAVWFHLYAEDKYAPKDAQYAGIGYATTDCLDMYQEPGKIKAKAVYQVGQNSRIRVVDAAPVKSIVEGDDALYYKVMFVGSNDTYYMGYNYYYLYVNSKYINLHKADRYANIIEPDGSGKARIANVDKASYIVYSKKSTSSTKVNTLLQTGAKVLVNKANTDKNWAAIYVNGREAYIPVDKLKYYIDEVKIANVVDNKYVLSWGNIPVKVNAEFYDRYGKKVNTTSFAASQDSVKLNSSLVKPDNSFSTYYVQMVAKAAGTSDQAKVVLAFPANPSSSFSKRSVSNNQVTLYGTLEDAQVEYATNKSFKNAKKTTAPDNFVTVKNLKKNTQYYFRYRNVITVKTEAGNKKMYGSWSKTVAVKTTNVTVKMPVLKKPVPGKNKVSLKWNKYTGNGSFHEILVATDKKFTKNVKKGGATKSKNYTEINGLKSKTTYYVKMRTVYNHGPQTYYSNWTKVKSFKTK